MRKSYSLKLSASPTGDEVIIYLRVIVDRRKAEFSTGVRGVAIDWKDERQRFSERSRYNCSLNYQLTCMEERIDEICTEIIRSGAKLTAIGVKEMFKGKKDVRHTPMLLDYIQHHISVMEKQPDEYSKQTIIHYNAMYKRLKNYLKSVGDDKLKLKDITPGDLMDFREYLLTTDHEQLKRPMKPATAGKYLSKLKTVINGALAKGLINNNPFSSVKIDRVKSEAVWLTQEELDQLIALDLSGNILLTEVREAFLLSVYTGLRFGDAFSLRKSQIIRSGSGYYRLITTMEKTQKDLDIRMIPEAIEHYRMLIRKYPDIETVLPSMGNGKMNKNIRLIGKMAGIKKKVTHHVARHTFATTMMMEKGADIKLVSHMLGHRSLKVTEAIYARYTRRAEDKGIEAYLAQREQQKAVMKFGFAPQELTSAFSLN